MPSMQEKIEQKLRDAFDPEHLKIINESFKHKGHAGDDGSGESHFQIEITSGKFTGNRVKDQRMVFNALREEMEIIHALSMQLNTTHSQNQG